MPVGRAGDAGEGGRHGEEIRPGLGQRPIELRKAQIVADGHAEPAPGQLRQHGLGARPIGLGFLVALPVGHVDVEHVDLVVTRPDPAAGIDQERAVGETILGHPHDQRAEQQPDVQRVGQPAQGGEHRMVVLAPGLLQGQRAPRLHHVAGLRRHDELRAGAVSFAD